MLKATYITTNPNTTPPPPPPPQGKPATAYSTSWSVSTNQNAPSYGISVCEHVCVPYIHTRVVLPTVHFTRT